MESILAEGLTKRFNDFTVMDSLSLEQLRPHIFILSHPSPQEMTVDCVSRTVNVGNCACTNEECERRGVCCACVANHHSHGNLPACLRPPAD